MILLGDCREVLPTLAAGSVQMCCTSPPYFGLRDYGVVGQVGMEPTPEEYVAGLVEVFREVRRVLREDGTLWLNLGDSYAAHPGQRKVTDIAGAKQQTKRGSTGSPSRHVEWLKPKDLIGIPWRVAFALQADGWWLRSDIIWSKPNPMPESVTDRPTKAHEYIFLLTKSERYFYDADAIAERAQSAGRIPGGGHKTDLSRNDGDRFGRAMCSSPVGESRNARSVWEIATRPYSEAHFATFPAELARRCILAGSKPGDTILDPFNGAGTTGLVAQEHNRQYIGIELNADYIGISERRLAQNVLDLGAA